jgi:hypothetical protein
MMTDPAPPGHDPDHAIRANIRAAVTRAGRHQTEVAAAAGLSWPQWQRRMSNVPHNRARWTVDQLQRVAHALNVPITDLTGDTK